MNKRIKELYIQSIQETKHNPADDINIQIAEKFAELLIDECTSIYDVYGDLSDEHQFFALAKRSLQRQFGLKI